MAVIATTRLSLVNYHDSKLSISGFPVEQWRLDASQGYAAADTLALTGSRDKAIKAVIGLGDFYANIPAASRPPVSTTVTMTATRALTAGAAPRTIDFFIVFDPL